jgi:hypothetical protein
VANRLEHRLVAAANADLRRHRFVAPVDVLIGLGWLSKEHAEAWRRGRVPYLEQVTEASLGKLSSALRILQSRAQSEGLQPSETIYVSWTQAVTGCASPRPARRTSSAPTGRTGSHPSS